VEVITVVNQLLNKVSNKALLFFVLLLSFPFGLANIVNIFIPIEIVFNSLLIIAIELILIYMNAYFNFSKQVRSIDKAFWFYIFFNLITNILFVIWGIFYLASNLSI
jgi:hypothetical protein